MTKNFSDLKLEDIDRSYTGKRDRCCCGCAGTYVYASGRHENPARVNDARIKYVFNLMAKNVDELEVGPNYIAFERNTTLYILYPKNSFYASETVAKVEA